MEDSINLTMTKAEAEMIETLLDDFLLKMREANERMDREEAEIGQLKLETRAMLRQIEANLNVEKTL